MRRLYPRPPRGAPLKALPSLASLVWGLCLAGLMGGAAQAAPGAAASAPIYSCIDHTGRRISADRPIPECLSQEQRLLNRDGSVRGMAPPLISPDERTRREKLQRDADQAQARKDEAVRRDRNLLARYPQPATHEEARARALAPTLQLITNAKSRLATLARQAEGLAAERAKLADQPLPEALRSRIGSNEGATAAQRSILRNQEAERDRLILQFAVQRVRLELLWAGNAPGSVDEMMPSLGAVAAAASAAASGASAE